jgi:thioredoxin reductase (NADPH)
MTGPARTDVAIVGAGPVGLFAVFQLGLFDMRCHVVDSLDRPGGQCAELYHDKPIYDVPGHPKIVAQDLVARLVEQAAPFDPAFTFDRRVTGLDGDGRDGFRLTLDDGATLAARAVVVAAGAGAFVPRPRPRLGRTMERAAVAEWGLAAGGETVPVSPETFETRVPGVFAIGDVASYPGKLRLILCGFHEAALMAQAARRRLRPSGPAGRGPAESGPEERTILPYTSTSTSLHRKLARP